MLTSGTVTALASELEAAGDVLVDIDFEDGLHDFQTYVNGGAFDLAAENGELAAHIHNCGTLDYANQAYYDGFGLVQGCEYTYSFDIRSDIQRTVEYRIQLNGGDYHAYQGEKIQVGPDVTHFSVDFTMEEASDPAPRICFNMGLQDGMDTDPGEHTVYIDNLRLVVKDTANAVAADTTDTEANNIVTLDQVGYLTDASKTVYVKDASEADTFALLDAESGETVWEGKLEEPVFDEATQVSVSAGDFSEVTRPGTYQIQWGENLSYPFVISEDPYSDVWTEAVKMLTRHRCGVETDPAVVGEKWAHPACHTTEATVYGTTEKKDVSGGWHDAGDYGRYVVSAAKTVMDLLLAYEDFGLDSDELGIPESGNGVPDLLDETRFELEWMLKMQNEKNGGVYHKVTCASFPDMVAPELETAELILSPISTTATADFAGTLAKAAAVYRDVDPAFADTCYEAAKKAYDYVDGTHDTEGFHNPSDISTGEYPDSNTTDEMFFATAQLYLTAASADPASDRAKLDASHYAVRLKENFKTGNATGLGWADMGSYGLYDLAKLDSDVTDPTAGTENSTELDDELTIIAEASRKALVTFADGLLQARQKDGYHQTMGRNYPWGSNMTVANNGMTLLFASRLTGDDKYTAQAADQLHYLLGANALAECFVSGFGTASPQHPHHRPSVAAGQPMPGMLAGGPDGSLEDPYAKNVLDGKAPALCWTDSDQSYSTNEVTVYWNSPMIYLMGAFLG